MIQEVQILFLEDMIFVCDEAYTKGQFIETEWKLMCTLNFDINLPVASLYMRKYGKIVDFTLAQVIFSSILYFDSNFIYLKLTLARYVLELSLLDHQFVSIPPSKMASAAIYWTLLHFERDWVRIQ